MRLASLMVVGVLGLGCGGTDAPAGDEDRGVREPPLEQPICCGCTCVDETWSCSEDTCLLSTGSVVDLAPEAGFFELEPETYTSWLTQAAVTGPRARVWYSFRPADEAPEDKPLIVFFNGGPSAATTSLLTLNTGPVTLDPKRLGDAPYADNPDTWTRFANLLYVDQPGSGFSYFLARDGDPVGPLWELFDPWHDAAQFASVVLAFLERHPQLARSRVVLAGQSYGGLRAVMMQHLLRDLDGTADAYDNPSFTARRERFSSRLQGRSLDERFDAALLLQPYATSLPGDNPNCPPDSETYQCDEPAGYDHDLDARLVDAILTPSTAAQLYGVDLATIAWLRPEHRDGVFGRTDGEVLSRDDSLFEEAFGALAEGDRYRVSLWSNSRLPWSSDPGDLPGRLVLHAARHSSLFITDAALDDVVVTGLLPERFRALQGLVASATRVDVPTFGGERRGLLEVELLADSHDAETIMIPFPHYAQAGHSVTDRASAALADDVALFLEGLDTAP